MSNLSITTKVEFDGISHEEFNQVVLAVNSKQDWLTIVNSLIETEGGKVLDARQGKILKDLIDVLTTAVNGKEATGVAASLVDAIKAGSSETLASLKTSLNTLQALVTGTAPDGDSVVNTIQELLAIFSTYPEGVNVITALAAKVDAASIVNTLTEVTAGKVLDARQGKVLSDLITGLKAGSTETIASLKTSLDTLNALVTGTTPDGDSVVNTIQELLAIFATYPEGTDIATLLAGKVSTSMYNTNRAADQAATATAQNTANAANRYVPLILIMGESNAGGLVSNTLATPQELALRPAVQILNNTTLAFESLRIGVNNMLGHTGHDGENVHGWENELATQIEAGQWWNLQVYLVKSGQGGSKIAEWAAGGTYWNTFLTRMNAALTAIKASGKIPLTYVWYTQGINDSGAGTAIDSWGTSTIAHIEKLRTYLGYVPILMTKFPSPSYDVYSAQVDALAGLDPWNFAIDVSGAGVQQDGAHWSYTGMKLIADRMRDVCLNSVGQQAAYVMKKADLNYAKSHTIPTLPASVGASNPVSWTALTSAVDSGTGVITYSGSGAGGGTSTIPISASANFEFVVDYSAGSNTDANIVFLDDKVSANYNFNAGNSYVSGTYRLGNALTLSTSGTTNTGIGTLASYNTKLKGRKVGNNVVYSVSNDNGVTYTDLYTHVGVLSGKSTLYLRVMWGSPQAGKTIKVSLALP